MLNGDTDGLSEQTLRLFFSGKFALSNVENVFILMDGGFSSQIS